MAITLLAGVLTINGADLGVKTADALSIVTATAINPRTGAVVQLTAPAGSTIDSFWIYSADIYNLPSGRYLPEDQLDIRVSGLPSLTPIDLVIETTNPDLPLFNGYVLAGASGSWSQLPSNIVDASAPGRVTLTIVEGGSDDPDGVTDGVLSLVGGPTAELPESPPPSNVTASLSWASVSRAEVWFWPMTSPNYPVTYKAECSAPNGELRTATGENAPLYVDDLTPGGDYSCTVRTVNALKEGPPSAPSFPSFAVPNVPDKPWFSVEPGTTPTIIGAFGARVSADPRGAEVTRYRITCAAPGAASVVRTFTTNLYDVLTVTGLNPRLTYTCRAVAINAVGSSVPSDESTVMPISWVSAFGSNSQILTFTGPLFETFAKVPTIPAGLPATVQLPEGLFSIGLHQELPAGNGANQIFLSLNDGAMSPPTYTGFSIHRNGTWRAVPTYSFEPGTTEPPSGYVTASSFPGSLSLVLVDGGDFDADGVRNGSVSFVGGPTIGSSGAQVPGAPTGLAAVRVVPTEATISFNPPADNGGADIAAYTATCSAPGHTATGTSSASPVKVTVLAAGVAYSCSVVATNSVGSSVPSPSVAVAPPKQATSGTGANQVTLSSPAFTTIQSFTKLPLPAVPPPTGTYLPFGMYDFTITGVGAGQAATFSMSYPVNPTVTVTGYAKYQGGTWTMLPASQVDVSTPGRVTVTIVDGSQFDQDGSANGVVVDPGGVTASTALTVPPRIVPVSAQPDLAYRAAVSFPVVTALDASGQPRFGPLDYDVVCASGNGGVTRTVTTTLVGTVNPLAGIITTVAGTGGSAFGGDGGPATSASLASAFGVAVDGSGNLYIADTGNNRIRKVSREGTITTIAGNGAAGDAGDGGAATIAQLRNPNGVAIDQAGNVYIADTQNHRVRRVSATGIITTIAGTDVRGSFGDGGRAVDAALNEPYGVALDASGNLYIADTGNQKIRKVTTNGTITTVAGTGTAGYAGDGGPATSAQLKFPFGVALDASGNLYIADSGNDRIRKVTPAGTITTVAGTGTAGYAGDGGPATSAQLNAPFGVAVDATGTVYIADGVNSRLRTVSSSGIITTLAGTGSGGYSGDGGLGVDARINYPNGVAVDTDGNVFIADRGNNRIRKVLSGGAIAVGPTSINTIAGGGNSGPGDGGPAVAAGLKDPRETVIDAQGNLYIAEASGHRVRKVSPEGTISTFAGTGTAGFSGDGGSATSAMLRVPVGLTIDTSGNIYIADSGNDRIRKVTPAGIITTVAGTAQGGYSGDGGPAVDAKINDPRGVAIDASGNLYIADTFNHRIRKVTPAGIISTFAGTGAADFFGDGGLATSAKLNLPRGLDIDTSGNVYIADSGNDRVRRVTPTGIITTIAGGRTADGLGDGGPATNARLVDPAGVALDVAGNVFIAETAHRIRKVAPNGIITTFAGNNTPGLSGDGGSPADAQLDNPWRVSVDALGNVYISDGGNNRVRKVSTIATVMVTGLTGRAEYRCTVQARNIVGSSLLSTQSPAFTVPDVPDAPTDVRSLRYTDRIELRFSAPAGNGAGVNGYAAVCISPTDPELTVSTVSGPGVLQSITVPAPVQAATYDCTVSARNGVGSGPPSSSLTALPTPPAVPSVTVTLTGEGEFTVAFPTVSDTFGRALRYVAVCTAVGGSTSVSANGTSSPISVIGAVTGPTYRCTVETIADSTQATAYSGPSVPSAPVPTIFPPSPPTNLSGTRTPAGSLLTFTPSALDGGSRITDYEATCTSAGRPDVVARRGSNEGITVPIVIREAGYTCTVVALNAAGSSGPSQPFTFLPLPADNPTTTAVRVNRATIEVSFPPVADSTFGTVSYDVTCSVPSPGIGSTVAQRASTSPATLTGLTVGQRYACKVVRANATGSTGGGASSTLVLMADPPSAPTSVTGTRPSVGSAVISFGAPTDNGGSPVIDYAATCAGPGGVAVIRTETSSPITLTGLTPTTAYSCTVTARNEPGSGAASTPVVLPAGATPGAPGISSALPVIDADRDAVIVFTPPSSDGGWPITSYTVTCTSTNGGATVTKSGPASPIEVDRLTPNRSYRCTVAAVNEIGTGTPSAPTPAFTTPTTPGRPTGVTAVADGNRRVSVSYTPPAYIGTSVITQYTLRCTSSNGGVTPPNVVSLANPLVMTGLTAGKTYTCTLFAQSAAGVGPTVTTNSFFVLGLPGAPQAPVATANGSTRATVTYQAPIPNGSDPVTSYATTCTSSTGGVTRTASVAAPGLSISVSSLTAGATYTCTVTATNSAGTGPASTATAPFTPPLPPQPTAVSVTTTGTTAQVAFMPAAANGSDPVVDYAANCTSTTTGVTTRTGARATSPITITGFVAGATYTCTVTARAGSQLSPASVPSAPFTFILPLAPANVSVTMTGVNATVAFDPPVSAGGEAVTGYRATCTSTTGGITRTGTATPPARTSAVNTLTAGATYVCSVVAINPVGPGPAATSASFVVPTVPGAPTTPTATADSSGTGAVVRFSPPTSNGGSTVTSYVVSCTPTAGGTARSASGIRGPLAVTGLIAGTAYRCNITAANAVGTGPAATVTVTTPGLLAAPTGLDIELDGSGRAVIATFTPLAPSPGSPEATGYRVTCTPVGGGTARTSTVSGGLALVTGLVASTTYNCTVATTSNAGVGTPSPAVAVTTT